MHKHIYMYGQYIYAYIFILSEILLCNKTIFLKCYSQKYSYFISEVFVKLSAFFFQIRTGLLFSTYFLLALECLPLGTPPAGGWMPLLPGGPH